MMNAIDFEIAYAAGVGITVPQLRARGRVVVPCMEGGPGKCLNRSCPGWNSIPRDVMEDYKMMGRVPRDWVWPP